jgi:hypothetical protein
VSQVMCVALVIYVTNIIVMRHWTYPISIKSGSKSDSKACRPKAKRERGRELKWREGLSLVQGHLVKGGDKEAFSSLLWSGNCTSKMVGARPNLRPHLM